MGKLKKAVYDLVQAGRCRYDKLNNGLKVLEFEPSHANSCAYCRVMDIELEILIVAYVDDFLIASKGKEVKARFVAELESRYKIKDLGEVSYYIVCHTTHNREVRELKIA